ncbi:MAG: DUF5752 family protein [Candidatus Muiribacteriota bacterium]
MGQNYTFNIKDCALVAIGTGEKAHNIRELKDIVKKIHSGCIHYHFWDVLLKPGILSSEYNNDIANWVKSSIHDYVLAERLAVIDPSDYPDIEDLREELIDIIEQRLDENEWLGWIKPINNFNFIRSHIVVFNTNFEINKPYELKDVIPKMSLSSIYYHFIDARKRTDDHIDDFRVWLSGFNGKYQELIDDIASLDPFFVSINDLKKELTRIFNSHFEGVA